MRKTALRLLGSVLLVTVLAGCWNRKELNDLGIMLGIAIDKVGEQYQIAAQVVVPEGVASQKNTGATSPVTIFKATAPTLQSAFRKLTETSPRKIYGAHIRVLVLGEPLAREGIADAIDLLVRDHEIRSDFYVTVAKGAPAEDVLKILTTLEKIPANKLFKSLDVSAKVWAPTTTVTLGQLLEKLLGEGENAVLTGVQIIGNAEDGEKKRNTEEVEPAAVLRFSGLAVLRKDKLIGWLNDKESKGYNYITDQVKSTAAYLECPDGGLLTLETLQTHTDIKGRMAEGEPVIEIKLVTESQISEAACGIDLTDEQTIRMLESTQERNNIKLMENAVSVVKSKFKTDIFGFGQAIYRADPKAWKLLKSDWGKRFADLKVVYDAKVYIRKVGMTNEPLHSMIKE
ncbi:MAG: spore gernimation protein GerC [Paenibacillus sp.]|nr:spore gernimation protein GerC [Paenibacillus sp.]